MTLTQLATFRTLARELHFTRTAEALHLTQPAVSQHLAALTEHFGVVLVDRIGRVTRLTDAGRFLAARAEIVLGSIEALEHDMREFADARAGELRLGATVTIGAYALPEIVARFRAVAPAIRLDVTIANTTATIDALRSGRIGFALVEGPLAGDDLTIEAYAIDELLLVVPLAHAFASRREAIDPAELAGEAFVVREPGSGTREQVDRALADAGVAANVALTLPTGEGIVRAVACGIGIAIISRLVAEDAIRNGRVVHVALRNATLTRTFRFVTMRDHALSPAARAFIAVLRAATSRSEDRSVT